MTIPPLATPSSLSDRPGLLLLASAALVVLTRLPQLASPHLFACGDEAIVGMMAQRLLAGEDLPLFFYGQSYMLAVVELLCATTAIAAIGSSVFALKVGALLSWGLGVALYALAVRRLAGGRVAWIAAVLLCLTPAWGRISMMYTGALSVSCLTLWLLARLGDEPARRTPTAFALGAALAITGFVHPLWLAVVVPFAPLALAGAAGSTRVRPREGLALLCGALFAGAFLIVAGPGGKSYWAPPILQGPDLLRSALVLPERLFTMLGGHYFLTRTLPMGPATRVATVSWTALALIACAAALLPAFRRAAAPLPACCLASIALVSGFSLLTNPELFGPRYLLPLTPALVLLVALLFDRLLARGGGARRAATAVLVLVAGACAASLVEVRRTTPEGYEIHAAYPEAKALDELMEALARRDVRHVYSTDPMLQWNLMFEGEGRLRARWFPATDRLPRIPREVDRALFGGEPIAVVGRQRAYRSVWLRTLRARVPEVVVIGPHYFAAFGPDARLLRELGFVLDRRWPRPPP